ncbi:MAG: hypothetical protein ACUVSY_02025 [Roseiflexus sp.]
MRFLSTGRTLLIAAVFIGILCAWLIVAWLDAILAPGAGGVWLALTVTIGGVAVRLRQKGTTSACTMGPRLRPLQVSCFGTIALGVHLLHATETGVLMAAIPILAAPWLPAACILGGVGGLAILSLGSDCRNAAFSGETSEEQRHGAT